jgi:CelD/BcsL family acetyltransferase involved in cellulose biosynthesis
MLELKVITDYAELETLAEQWERLFRATENASIFTSYEWTTTWWSHFRGTARLHVLAAYRGIELVGIASMMLDDHVVAGLKVFTRIRFIGTGISDRLDFLIAPGAEQLVLELFATHLFGQRWDILDLDEIAQDSATIGLLTDSAKRFGAQIEVKPQSVCPTVSLPIHFNTYFESTSREIQRKIKRYRSRAADTRGFQLKLITGEDDLLPSLNSFLVMYRKYFSQRPGTSHLTGEQFSAFRREVAVKFARRGRLLLALLQVDGKDVAGQLCFQQGPMCYEYNRCYDQDWKRENVGTLLLWEVLRYCVANGCRQYDFLRGVEQFKLDWGAKPRQQLRARIYRRSAKMRLAQLGVHISRALTKQVARVESGAR